MKTFWCFHFYATGKMIDLTRSLKMKKHCLVPEDIKDQEDRRIWALRRIAIVEARRCSSRVSFLSSSRWLREFLTPASQS